MKKLITLLLSLFLLVSITGCKSEETVTPSNTQDDTETTSVYPTEWNLKDLFEDDDAWYSMYEETLKLTESFGNYRDTLNTVEGMLAMIQDTEDGQFVKNYRLLESYADYRNDLDTSDPVGTDMKSKVSLLESEWNKATAYISSEIYAIDLEQRKAMFSDERLAPYAYFMRGYLDDAGVVHSEETNAAIAQLKTLYGRAENAFITYTYSDLQYPEITMPDGSTEILSDDLFKEITDGDYDHDFVIEAANIYYSVPVNSVNTYASLLNTYALEKISEAKLAGYDSALEYVLHEDDVDPEIYENIKETVHELLPVFHEYLHELKELKGLDTMYYFDTFTSASVETKTYTFDEAVGMMQEALAVLGDDYVEEATTLIEKGHVDAYPKENKTAGGFEYDAKDSDCYPYIFLNFVGDYDSVSTLCHEMGHAMYDRFSDLNTDLNNTNNNSTIFTHEVASTNNEFLLNDYFLDKAETDEEKSFYISNMINLIGGTMLRQMMYSEFEEYFFEQVENGNALSGEDLNNKWAELVHEYYGDEVAFPEGFETHWAVIDHFYYGFYVYKYATSTCYSAATSQRIFNQEEGAVQAYRDFLSLGNSESPSELLKVAGVDPTDKSTYEDVIDFFTSLVEQYKELNN